MKDKFIMDNDGHLTRNEEWRKHCDEYKIPKELGITKEEAERIIHLLESEWIRFLDDEDEALRDKCQRFVEGKK